MRRSRAVGILGAVVVVWGASVAPPAAAFTVDHVVRASVSSSGQQADGGSGCDSMTPDGRYVLFESGADNLVPGDTNRLPDLFVRDLVAGTTTRANVTSSGKEVHGEYLRTQISAKGCFVAFDTNATDVVPGDTNGNPDVFIHDMVTGSTTRVSVSPNGMQGNDLSNLDMYSPNGISSDGRYLVFESDATNLVARDANGHKTDVFLRDTLKNTTTLVDVSSSGEQANKYSYSGSISPDGRIVTFSSIATNLAPGLKAHQWDQLFAHDMMTGRTWLISKSASGAEANGINLGASISADGRFVAFDSYASNLVPGETQDYNVLVADLQTGALTLASVSSSGREGNDLSFNSRLSANGRYVAFTSWASNWCREARTRAPTRSCTTSPPARPRWWITPTTEGGRGARPGSVRSRRTGASSRSTRPRTPSSPATRTAPPTSSCRGPSVRVLPKEDRSTVRCDPGW
jgi:hypothetical protein